MHLLLVNVCFTKKLSFIFSPLMFSRLFRQSEWVVAKRVLLQPILCKVYFVPKILSPASPRPGTMYAFSFKHSSSAAT